MRRIFATVIPVRQKTWIVCGMYHNCLTESEFLYILEHGAVSDLKLLELSDFAVSHIPFTKSE